MLNIQWKKPADCRSSQLFYPNKKKSSFEYSIELTMQSYFFSIIEKLVNWLQLWVKNRKCFIVNMGAKRHLFRVIEKL
jgi:hypothetical protein